MKQTTQRTGRTQKTQRTQRTGRKIDPDCENPIDNVLIHIADRMSDMVYDAWLPFRITPNMLTTISNVFSIFGLYFFYHRAAFQYFTCIWYGYFFDCLDGHYARKYDMCTIFGDYYDHISDILVHVAWIVIWGIKYSNIYLGFSYSTKIYIVLGALFLAFMTAIHVACQEMYHFQKADRQHHSTSLNIVKIFYLVDRKYMRYTRYFGVGTLMASIYTAGLICVLWN